MEGGQHGIAIPIKRSTNFTHNEISFLIQLAHEYKNILLLKQNDATTNKMKMDVWEVISEKYNNQFINKRSGLQLKMKFVDMKRQIRKKVAEYKRKLAAVNVDDDADKKPTLLFSADESSFFSFIGPALLGLEDNSSGVDPVTFEIVDDVMESNRLDDSTSRNSFHSGMSSDYLDFSIEETKIEPEDTSNISYEVDAINSPKKRKLEDTIDRKDHPTESYVIKQSYDFEPFRKISLNKKEETQLLEYYRRKESKEDREHKLLVQKYEMEISVLEKRLEEAHTVGNNTFEIEMIGYYRRKEVKEDKEHMLLLKKYELEIDLLQRSLVVNSWILSLISKYPLPDLL